MYSSREQARRRTVESGKDQASRLAELIMNEDRADASHTREEYWYQVTAVYGTLE